MEHKIDIEKFIYEKLGMILDTPNNWSLMVGALIIWIFTGGLFAYSSNNNFDMAVMLQDYIRLMSLASIIVGFFCKETEGVKASKRALLSIGICTYILSLLTIVTMKNFGIVWWIGYLVIKPVGIFLFLLLIKQLFLIVCGRKLVKLTNNEE